MINSVPSLNFLTFISTKSGDSLKFKEEGARRLSQNSLTGKKNKSKGGIYYGNHRKAKKQKFRGKKRRAVKCH